ncbi:MAG: DUF3109 family protein [Bacteroidetes bacterium]|nr:MAG: DUF3109 family protein [Bacteroidota bacterium]
MLIIDNVLISDEVVQEQFVCNLAKCKGGCCEDGDAGAPLTKEEEEFVQKYYPTVLPYLTPKGIKAIEKQGFFTYDASFGNVTPTIGGAMCAYGFKDASGTIQCSFEQAYNKGDIPWKKPISCHLFPLKISQSEVDPSMEFINYEPREDLCAAACSLGKELKVPAHQFVKEALIRKYGQEFFDTLDAMSHQLT